MNREKIKVAAIQMKCVANDRQANVKKALDFIEKGAKVGARLLVFPELFTTGYYCFKDRNQKLFQLAEPIPGPTTEIFSQEAIKYNMYIVCPLFEKAGPELYYNSACLIGPDGNILGKYSKTHIPLSEKGTKYSGGALEKYYFKPGSKFSTFSTQIGNIGILICYDRSFPETFRILALSGAEIIVVPSTIFPLKKAMVTEDWEVLAKARAMENGVFAIFVNRVGEEEDLKYFGHSLIVNPKGKIISKAGFDECIITADINFSEEDMWRRRRLYMRDRRPEIYSKLVELR